MKNKKGNSMSSEAKEYYLGLDCGTGSVGWAVTDTDYGIMKFHGKSMWGSRLFETAATAADRRLSRCARRRYQRSKQRIDLLDELLGDEIAKTDPLFLARINDSAYLEKDKSECQKNSLFNDSDYTDIDFFKSYPTIFHLRKALIDGSAKKDIRFLYLALHHILKNRGHFLFQGQSLSAIQSLKPLLEELGNLAESVLELSFHITDFEKAESVIKGYKGNARVFKLEEIINTSDSKSLKKLLKVLSGQKVDASSLFDNDELKVDDQEIKIDFQKADFDIVELSKLEDLLDADSFHLIEVLKGIYDWSILSQVMAGCPFLSDAKILQYDSNKTDLANLKYIFKTYFTENEYEEFFHSDKDGTFSRYIGQIHNHQKHISVRRTKMEDFYGAIKKKIENATSAKNDPKGQLILDKIADGTFLNLLISARNSAIPYQVHLMELDEILKNAEAVYPFLSEKDVEGLSVSDKIKSIMTYRIPYYVGPLVDNTKPENARKYAWMERLEAGKIYPWNFAKKVDIEASAANFITRMVNNCSYLPQEKVLPKNSLLYSEYMVLNELNNVQINNEKLTVEQKQQVFEKLFKKYKKVTGKRLADFVVAEGWFPNSAELSVSGIDKDFKSSLTSFLFFKTFLESKVLTTAEVEEIIFYDAVFESGGNILDSKIDALIASKVSAENLAKIKASKFKGWGRFSRKFLLGLEGSDVSTGEMHSVMYYLWNTNDNLMELLSKKYDFAESIEACQVSSITDLDYAVVEDLNVSPSVKRQIWQTLKVVKEIESVMKSPPKKIFIEFAREEREKKRTTSRRDSLINLYKSIKNPTEEDVELQKELENYSDPEIAKNDRLFFYYIQRGKCLYSGQSIDIRDLNSNIYDIDHIIPQSKIKDDSLNNRCLVLRSINADVKKDEYPLMSSIQNSQRGFWKHLLDLGFMSENKYNRLTRTSALSESELADFVNRQLVETQQSTKACAAILKQYFKDSSKIVYSKAGNVASFKNEYEIPKVRMINDLHHAKDAYLNIVVGNCYDTKFSRPGFMHSNEKYNLSHIFRYNIPGAWNKDVSIGRVKKELQNNNILFTRQTFCRSGQLFDLMPLKGSEKDNMIPRKLSDPKLQETLAKTGDKEKCIKDWVTQYGGYNSLAVSYFALIKYQEKKLKKCCIISIPIMYATSLQTDDAFVSFVSETYKFKDPEIVIRKIPINTLFEYNDYRICLSAKAGNKITFKNATPLFLPVKYEKYAKNLEVVNNRKKRFPKTFRLMEQEDYISSEENIEMYDELLRKIKSQALCKRPGGFSKKFEEARDVFIELDCEQQVNVLIQMFIFFGANSALSDFTAINEAKGAGKINLSSQLDLKKNKYVIIHQSVTGLYEKAERIC